MATLVELKAKYQLGAGAKYEPYANCDFCHGTGERTSKSGDVRFCICLFVDHVNSNWIGHSLSRVAKKLQEDLNDRLRTTD